MQEDQIDVGLPEAMSRGYRLFGSVDQAKIHDGSLAALQPFGHPLVISRESVFQAVKIETSMLPDRC